MDQQPLDIASLPLGGRLLIEASAGTGKTFTLAALYVRLVLGHGDANGFGRPLMPDQILVVTYTRAATEELRERIRTRLREARDVLLELATPDALLSELLAGYFDEHRMARAHLLENAVRMMDDAAIFTIHGFCQRMLKRHAFDSRSHFDVELTADGSALFDQALMDYWRRHYYSLSNQRQLTIHRLLPSLEALGTRVDKALKADVDNQLLADDGLVDIPASVDAALADYDKALEELGRLAQAVRQLWQVLEITELLEQKLDNGAFKANQINSERLAERLALLGQWCESDERRLPPALLGSNDVAWFGQQRLHSATKKGFDAPQHAFFQRMDELAQAQQQLPDPVPGLVAHAVATIGADIQSLKQQRSVLGFDDLLAALDDALRGPLGERLARTIRRELPVALIDEFQDTDARQFRIFEHIYPLPSGTPADSGDQSADTSALLLIGDPKQAIYSFRNADLATYLYARDSVQGRYTLARNFRSSTAMVTAVNRLFAHGDHPFMEEGLAFTPSDAPGRSERLCDADVPVAALTWWLPEATDRVGMADYLSQMSAATRADIQRLLEGGDSGQFGFKRDSGEVVPIKAADIAVLVRTGKEAMQVREALAQGGIKSVYLSQKESVFKTHEAFWLLQLLEAVANPRDERTLRAALSSSMLGDGLAMVERLTHDEHYWEAMVERFEGYHRQWRSLGVLAMLYRLMRDFSMAARLLEQPGGERRLTDFLHLAELAQRASQSLDGEQALLRWLHRGLDDRFDDGLEPESLVQRLESDESLVRVVTIHGSKGLEYPVVYLPFACSYQTSSPLQGAQVIKHPRHGRTLALAPTAEQLEWVNESRLAEDVRLLYVALTRARYACRVGVAPLYKGKVKKDTAADATTLHESALGRVLFGAETISGTTLARTLAGLNEEAILSVTAPPIPPSHPYQGIRADTHERTPRRFTGHIDRHWWIASYSALTDLNHTMPALAEAEFADASLDLEVATEQTPIPAPPLGAINDFPRGPRAGTFLHGLLEAVDFDRVHEPAYAQELAQLVQARIERSSFDNDWTLPLNDWLLQLLQAPLNEQGDCQLALLGQDGQGHWQAELEFWLPVVATHAERLDALIRHYERLAPQENYKALARHRLEGMLRGFIDLVFEWQGKWYLIDWKSNHLGEQGEDYQQAGLLGAMVEHRYDVQYVLYVLALHRHLKVRLPDYDYERDMGGIYYLFLRGVDRRRPGQGIFSRRPPRELIDRLDDLLTHGDVAERGMA